MGIACGAFPSALTSPGAPAPPVRWMVMRIRRGVSVQGGTGGGAVTVPLLIWRVRFARFWSQVATIAPWVELGDAAQSLLGELAADLPGVAIRMVNAADRLAQALHAVIQREEQDA